MGHKYFHAAVPSKGAPGKNIGEGRAHRFTLCEECYVPHTLWLENGEAIGEIKSIERNPVRCDHVQTERDHVNYSRARRLRPPPPVFAARLLTSGAFGSQEGHAERERRSKPS